MILTPLLAVLIALIPQGNTTTNAIALYQETCKETKSWDYPTKFPERYHMNQRQTCERYRDNIYEYSEYVEQDIENGRSTKKSINSLDGFMKGFYKNKCHENHYISTTDIDLINKLEKDIHS